MPSNANIEIASEKTNPKTRRRLMMHNYQNTRTQSQRFVKSCDQNIHDAIALADAMIDLAARGDRDREDAGCGILYGILRDAGYKIKKAAEKEKLAHIRKGLWEELLIDE